MPFTVHDTPLQPRWTWQHHVDDLEMKSFLSSTLFFSITLTHLTFQILASPILSSIKLSTKPSLSQILHLPTFNRTLTDSPVWPALPYRVSLPYLQPPVYHIPPAFLIFTNTNSPILSEHETHLFLRLLLAEIDYLVKYPDQFDVHGISVARSFTENFLTCHQANEQALWTLEVAVEMLRAVGILIEDWGVRGFQFEVWVGEPGWKKMYCEVWTEPARRESTSLQ